MGKIVISTNVSLDGVVQDPDGREGFEQGGWFGEFGGTDLEEWTKVSFNEALGTTALLLGRRSDEWFAERWLARTGDWADRLNSLPKYVVSSTVEAARWGNATVLAGDVLTDELPLELRDRARPRRRGTAGRVSGRTRRRPEPVRREQPQPAHAPHRLPNDR